MPEFNLPQAIELARTMHRFGQPLELILANPAIPERFHSEVREAITPTTLQVPELTGGVAGDAWVHRPMPYGWYYWSRLEKYLRYTKGWDRDVIHSIAEWSLRILAKVPDPRGDAFDCRGLVVGYVQSGKTANYTAVAARAADAGYRLIIVLSGIHNALREQTQFRLDQELTGEVPASEPSVGRPEHGRRWVRLTYEGQDFPGVLDPGMLQGDVPILVVVKKHKDILESFIARLRNAGKDALRHLPMLVIDDESDQASVNTGENRAAADCDLDAEELEETEAEAEPSRINALIRDLLNVCPRRAYVGYTASPFANVLISPDDFDREVGATLFPKDFILQLPRPQGYTGTAELFGTDGSAGRNVLRFVPDDEAKSLRPTRAGRLRFNPSLTPSLARATEDFILAGAVRLFRGQAGKANTMLVHTTHYTDAQARIADALRQHVEALQGEWQFGGPEAPIRARLRERWENDYRSGVDKSDGLPASFNNLTNGVDKVLERLHVLELNSASAEELDYRRGGALQVIAVGGNRLSRGLTLEGLTVSYFLRASGMCDTLLQMARWYGYRHGFEDLMRIHTTQDLASWFAELALVERDLRDELDRMNLQGLTPREQGVRIRSHSSMLLTSRLKMKNGTAIRVGYSGDHPQIIVFPLEDTDALNRNVDLARDLLADTEVTLSGAGILASGISVEQIARFIERYEYSDETRALDPRHLAAWLRRRADHGELVEWTIYVDGRADAALGAITLGGHPIGMVQRTRLQGTSSVGTLIDPKHEGVDLGDIERFRRGQSYDSGAMRAARPRHQGLLLLYPISPASTPDKKGSRAPLYPEESARPECVLGFGLSLPHVSDDSATQYVVGTRWAGDTR